MLMLDDAVPSGAGVIGLLLNEPPAVPDAERVTGDAKLLNDVTVTSTLPDEPCTKIRFWGASPIEKSPKYSIKAQEFAWHSPSAYPHPPL
jgi:hypothetical protein